MDSPNQQMISPQIPIAVWREIAKFGVLVSLLVMAVYSLWNLNNQSQNELKKELGNRIKSLEKRLDECDSNKKDRIEKKIDDILIEVRQMKKE